MAYPLPRLRSGVCVALALTWSTSLGAQEPRPLLAPAEFAIDQWTTEDGLPQNSVNAMARGVDGYLWIGTFGGLARFDGTTFTRMERTDAAGRHVDRVLSLAVGPDSSLWIGTESGLVRRKGGVYHTLGADEGVPVDEISVLHTGATGTVWIGTTSTGLAWFDGATFGALREFQGRSLGRVLSIVESADHTIRVSTDADLVLVFPHGDPTRAEWRRAPLPDAPPLLLEDRAGARWFDASTGATRVSDGSVRTYNVPGGAVMVEDAGGGYWMGTINDGLYAFHVTADTALVRRYPLPDGRLQFRVRSAYPDEDGSVWVGTDANGLLRARRNLFATYTVEHGLSHDVATAVLSDPGGTVWVGTNCGGVNEIDPARRTVRTFNPRSPDDPEGDPCISALARGADGVLWQGTYGGGVTALGRTPGSPQRPVAEIPDSVVLALFTDRAGTLWVGTRTGGVAAIQDHRVLATYTTADGLAHNSVRTIQQTRDGALWFGTLEGLSRFGEGRWSTHTAADGLSAGHVRAIHEDRDGTLWIGTYGGGLNRLADGVFTPIMRSDGLADDVVSAILEDDDDNFWMSGNRGIYRVSRSQLNAFADGRIQRVHSVLYGRGDGLRNPETNGGFQPAGWKDARGHLWFPTLEGIAVVDPAQALPTGHAPSVTLEAVVVDGVMHPPGDAVTLGPGRPNLEIRYAGLSLSAPEHVTFRYRLDGYDADWVDAGARRTAYYPRLPAGTYQFRVRAASRDGAWGAESAGLPLRVLEPFWSTWWFRFLAAVALLGLAVVVIRRREAGARRERAAQDEFSRELMASQEQERKRLAGELHDGLGQDLLIVRNRVLLALRADGMGPAAHERLQPVLDVVTSALQSIREMAHNLSPHQLHHLGLSSALETMAEAVAETSEIDLDATIEPIDHLLPSATEINLYRIVQEGLTNVVRHSGARAAMLHVRRDGETVRVTISDAGRGFSVRRDGDGRLVAGFGLSGMAERARILNGKLEIQSAPGCGVRIDLSVPAARAGT